MSIRQRSVYGMCRVRNALRKYLKMSDDNLTMYLRQRYGVADQCRENLLKLVNKEFPWMLGVIIR